MNERLWVVVPAAGQGVRAGLGVPKQFAPIAGKTVLEWTVSRVLALPEVSGVVVAMPAEAGSPPDSRGSVQETLLRMSEPDRPIVLIPGGTTRQESVYLALAALPADVRWVAVQDAARPCFSQDLFRRVWAVARVNGAAICGLKPTDTVKFRRMHVSPESSEPGEVVGSTPDRELLVNVQTPQIFEARLLKRAHQAARDSGWSGTDDSQLVEALGHPVAFVPGERGNLKITYPEDLDMAEKRLVGDSGGLARNETGGPHTTVTGLGFDIHPLVSGRKCVLGGIVIPSDKGPLGHSDGDVLCHAVMDALLGSLGQGDIGVWFPPGDPQYEGANSLTLMRDMWKRLAADARTGLKIVHIDATVIAEVPRVSPFYGAMRDAIGSALGISPEQVSIKATTAERLGAVGREEGIAAFAVATLLK